MQIDLYKPSELEQWINKRYRDNGIFYADDLDIHQVAEIFNVDIVFYEGPCFAEWDDETSVIFINAYLRPEQRREAFFHELCHPTRHVGFEDEGMAKTFMEHLEREANLFQLYAAMPIYMLQEFWDVGSGVYSSVLAKAFCLPEKLVRRRLEQVENRIYTEQVRLERIHKQREGAQIKITYDHVRKVMEEYGRRYQDERRA